MEAPFNDDIRDVICPQCQGKGIQMICPDDICRATGECRHNKGYSSCHECNGEGYISIDINTNKRVVWEE